jgi:hypothetical protein
MLEQTLREIKARQKFELLLPQLKEELKKPKD